MQLEKLEKYMVNNMGCVINLERICKMVRADFYMKKDDDEFVILEGQIGNLTRIGRIVVRNGGLVDKVEKMLAGFYRKAVPKPKPPVKQPNLSLFPPPPPAPAPAVPIFPPAPETTYPPPLKIVPLTTTYSTQPTKENTVTAPALDSLHGKPKDREFETVEPVHFKKLYAILGNYEAVGRLLGVTGGSIKNNIAENRTRLVNELAAQYIYERDYNKQPEMTTGQALTEYELLKQAVHTVRTLSKKLDFSIYLEDGGLKLRRIVKEEL